MVVDASAPEHFVRSDEALLVAFCGAAVLERQATEQLRLLGPVVEGKLSPWVAVHEKSVRSMSALAVRLRLGPSTRAHPRTVARRVRGLVGVDAMAALGLDGAS